MTATPFQFEAWVEYAIGMTILLARIAYRVNLVGWDWHGDDFFAVGAVCFLTVWALWMLFLMQDSVANVSGW
jgi:hypothetical protein